MDCGPIFNHLPLFHCEASCLNVAMIWGPTLPPLHTSLKVKTNLALRLALKEGMWAKLDFLLRYCGPIKSGPTRAALSSKEVKGFLSATLIVHIHIGRHFW